jgi:acetyl-CoA carboxylase carboxyltransferase component
MRDEIEGLRKRKALASEPGTEEAIARQRARGKLLARERIDHLVDPGSFQELGMFVEHRSNEPTMQGRHPETDGVVAGMATIDDRDVCVFAQDPTVFGGSVGKAGGAKIAALQDLALEMRVPIIGISDGGGARIQEGVDGLAAYGAIFHRNVRASGIVPQISVILGISTGGASYSPALTDFTFMVEGTSAMSITGPDVVKAATNEDVTAMELGGAEVHATKSGVAQFVADDERSCLDEVRRLLGFLPDDHGSTAPRRPTRHDRLRRAPELAQILPADMNATYDVRDLLAPIVDDAELLEYSARWAPNIVCAFARLDGQAIGVVANQPAVFAGTLDLDACQKAARFVRTCDAFNLPIVTVVDSPGFLPGVHQEHGGMIRHGAKLLYAYAEATVPRIQLVVRKGYGTAYVVLGSKSTGTDLVFAWPTAQIAVMGSAGAVDVLHRTELAEADDPTGLRARLLAEYEERWANPYDAARLGMVDDVIEPPDTRPVLIRALRPLARKERAVPPRKHGNIPF